MRIVAWVIVAVGLLAACSSAPSEVPRAPSSTSMSAPTTTFPTATTTTTGLTATPPYIRIAVAGDTGTGAAPQMEIAARIAQGDSRDDYAALVLLGDLIYPEGDPSLIDSVLLEPYAETLDGGTVLVPALGNHDIMQGRQDEILARLGRDGSWYAEHAGNALLVILDSNRPNDPDQLAWLESELAASDDRWIIAAMHHPPYSAGAHGSSVDVRAAFVPLFEQYGVDLVLAGHDHDYQRSKPINGVTYVVSGGGAKLRPTGSANFTRVSASMYHYVELKIDDETMAGTVFGLDGVIDEFTIQKGR